MTEDDVQKRLDYDFKHWKIGQLQPIHNNCEHCFCQDEIVYQGGISTTGSGIPHKRCCMCSTRRKKLGYE